MHELGQSYTLAIGRRLRQASQEFTKAKDRYAKSHESSQKH